MFFRRKTSAESAYLEIVESRRDTNQVRQQVVATLGRYEELQPAVSRSDCCNPVHSGVCELQIQARSKTAASILQVFNVAASVAFALRQRVERKIEPLWRPPHAASS